MSIYLYEESIVNELREITGDDRIHIITPSQSISFLAQYDKDKVTYPSIVMSRGPINLGEYKNQVQRLKGETSNIDQDNYVVKAQLIDVRISWNLDIYTVDRYTNDEICRELIFYFTTHPRFTVKIPYGLDISQNFDIFVSDDVVDNTDLTEFPNTGEFFRTTITIYTENAHLFSSHKQYQVIGRPDVDINNH